MRIIAGTLRGRSIQAPEGSDTRPTIDRVREALFSSLYSLLGGFEGLHALDAFAGSGALGLEALSRGVDNVVFYEQNKKAASVLKRNIAGCGLGSDRAIVMVRDVFAGSVRTASSPFDLVFLDPPYAYETTEVLGFVQRLRDEGALAEGAVIVYEHGLNARKDMADAASSCGLDVIAAKKYGKTAITLLKA